MVAGEGDEAAIAAASSSALQSGAPEGTGRRIFNAAEAGDMAALGPLVQEWSGHDVLNWATPDEHGWTPLMIVSRNDNVDATRLLLQMPGIDVNKADRYGWTAVMWTACFGHTEVARALLAAPGIDVNKRDQNGKTALGLAIMENKAETAALLRAAGAEE